MLRARIEQAERHFLEARRVGHPASADARGVPHAVPVLCAVTAGAAYIAIDEQSKRGGPAR